MERVESSDLRNAETNFALVEEIMFDTPQDLPENHRLRQTELEAVLKNGKLRQLILTLRDLSWKAWTDKLTSTDSNIRNRIQKRIIMEFAATPSMTVQIVRERITLLTEQAMQKHEETIQPQVVKA